MTCNALMAAGPDAPTLCEGWTCADLAAHLVMRESRPDAALGLVIPAAAGRTSRIQDKYARMDFGQLVSRLRSGPPALSPLRWFDGAANLIEFAVHHEDVRLPNPDADNEIPADIQDLLWRRLRTGARVMFRNVRSPLTIRTLSADEYVVRSGQGLTITGTPAQLLLEATGRVSGAQITGDEAAVDTYRAAKRGI